MEDREELFNNWRILGHRVTELNSVVRNSDHTTVEDHHAWCAQATAVHTALADLMQRTHTYLGAQHARTHQ